MSSDAQGLSNLYGPGPVIEVDDSTTPLFYTPIHVLRELRTKSHKEETTKETFSFTSSPLPNCKV